ncbi:MAG: uroporphyrinogen decarboxylase family protein [Holophaga sp.]|nr:uroporphyrinogen decarboxylase family protein [Holophaga sp.]
MPQDTPKAIILKAIRLEKTPRHPVALLSGGIWTLNRQGLSLEEALEAGAGRCAEIIAGTADLLRSDIVWTGSGYHNLPVRGLGGQIRFRKKGAPDVKEPLLTEPSGQGLDLDRLAEDPGIRTLWDTTRLLSRQVGEHILVGSSAWGPFTYAGLLYGVERLMRGIYRDKAAVHAALAFSTELSYRYLAPFVAAGAGLISVADPTASGDMISRRQFEEFVLPYQRQVVQRIKALGAATLVHICGDITDRLDLIPTTGAGILSMDYKVDLTRAAEVLQGKLAFAGNMNPVAIMQSETPEGVAAACRACIQSAGPESSHILMPGCDIPPGVPLENIRAMVDTAWESA